MRISECPECEGPTSQHWCEGRRLRSVCERYGRYCGWEGDPYVPETKEIKTTKEILVDFGGWTFEAFDDHGHIFIASSTYSTQVACEEAARRELQKCVGLSGYGNCTAVIWPPRVIVQGTLVKL